MKKCIFYEINIVQWISCRTKDKVGLYLNSKCQLLDLDVILRSFRGKHKSFGEHNVKSTFFRNKYSLMDKLQNKGKSKSLPQFKVPNTP